MAVSEGLARKVDVRMFLYVTNGHLLYFHLGLRWLWRSRCTCFLVLVVTAMYECRAPSFSCHVLLTATNLSMTGPRIFLFYALTTCCNGTNTLGLGSNVWSASYSILRHIIDHSMPSQPRRASTVHAGRTANSGSLHFRRVVEPDPGYERPVYVDKSFALEILLGKPGIHVLISPRGSGKSTLLQMIE